MKRQLLSLMLFIASLATFAQNFWVDGLYYNILSKEDLTCELAKSPEPDFPGVEINIPSQISYDGMAYTVTGIGVEAFESRKRIMFVNIPESVTSIGASAFKNCPNLKYIVIPESMKSIGEYAFYGCSALTNVYISDLTKWCNVDFGDASANPASHAHKLLLNGEEIKNLIIPDGVNSINDYTFYNCTGITVVTIPESVTSIGNEAFRNCSSLTDINIPKSVTSIGDWVFSGCSRLPVKDGTRYADCVAVESKDKSQTTYSIKEGTRFIHNRAFYNCKNLTGITIPNTVESIGGEAFRDCTSLVNVSIPRNVTSMGGRVFLSCTELSSIIVEQDNPQYDSRENCNAIIETSTNTIVQGCKNTIIPNSVVCVGGSSFYGCTGLSKISIPNSVTSIGENAFYDCLGLTIVDIPDSVTSIGENAFRNCSSLTSITIPNSIASIKERAFFGCSGLTSITIPNSVTSIGESSFGYCSSLTIVTIPNSVTSIGKNTFNGCSGLIEVIISCCDESDFCNYLQRADIYDIFHTTALSGILHSIVIGGQKLSSITIPESVTSIGYYAFSGCSGLTSITIPNSVTSVGGGCFNGCYGLKNVEVSCKDEQDFCNYLQRTDIFKTFYYMSELYGKTHSISVSGEKLTSVIIPESVTNIGECAFRNCSGLTSVAIGNSVTSIGSEAFCLCSDLMSITIPNSVTSIGEYAFSYCSSLTDVIISCKDEGDFCNYLQRTDISKIFYISDLSWNRIHHSISISGQKLTSVTIPESVMSIGEYAFRDCSGLTSVIIGNGVTSIGDYAFSHCYGLKSITIPNSVKNIGEHSFMGCSNTTDITVSCKDESDFCNYLQRVDIYKIFHAIPRMAHSISISGQKLTSITIPNSVKYISTNAFLFCSGLTSITIPESVTSIGDYAFYGCSALADVTCFATTPPGIKYYSFSEYGTLHVQPGRKAVYKAATYWKNFTIEEDATNGIEGVTIDTPATNKDGKFLENGRLFIRKAGKTYNASGLESK